MSVASKRTVNAPPIGAMAEPNGYVPLIGKLVPAPQLVPPGFAVLAIVQQHRCVLVATLQS